MVSSHNKHEPVVRVRDCEVLCVYICIYCSVGVDATIILLLIGACQQALLFASNTSAPVVNEMLCGLGGLLPRKDVVCGFVYQLTLCCRPHLQAPPQKNQQNHS